MNITDLREELAEQADEMSAGYRDLLPGARRHARRTRALRTAGAAAAVAVIVTGSTLVIPNLLPTRDTASTVPGPVAASPTAEPGRKAIRGVIRDGQVVELADGVSFTMRGKSWVLDARRLCATCKVHRGTLQPPADGSQGVVGGVWTADRAFTMEIVRGTPTDVLYAIRLPGQEAAVIDVADTYRLPSLPGWTLAYLEHPRVPSVNIKRFHDGVEIDIPLRVYDATGRYLR